MGDEFEGSEAVQFGGDAGEVLSPGGLAVGEGEALGGLFVPIENV